MCWRFWAVCEPCKASQKVALKCRHNGRDGVWNHQPHDCLVYSTVYSGVDQRKHQSSASLAFVWGIHRGLENSPHKGPVTRKMFPFDDVIMVSNSKRSLRNCSVYSTAPAKTWKFTLIAKLSQHHNDKSWQTKNWEVGCFNVCMMLHSLSSVWNFAYD